MPTFEEYLKLISEYRAIAGVDKPGEGEITAWRTDWAAWNKKRKNKEIENTKTHIIIAQSASAKTSWR